MAVYHLCDICRIRMSKFIVDIKETKDDIMNEDTKVWFDGDGYSPAETAPEMVSAEEADKAIAEAIKKALAEANGEDTDEDSSEAEQTS